MCRYAYLYAHMYVYMYVHAICIYIYTVEYADMVQHSIVEFPALPTSETQGHLPDTARPLC